MTEKSFAEIEREGWNRKAASYSGTSLPTTSQAYEPALDSLGELRDRDLLEVASGTGHLAALALERGARYVGLDVAPAMIELAKKNTPAADFRLGDGEVLPFAGQSFDAALCSFGLLHMPQPENAMAEVARVLRPGSRFAYTVWRKPEKTHWFGMIREVFRQHADMSVPLPEAPDMFMLADPDVHTPMLTAAGFTDIAMQRLDLIRSVPDAEAAIETALAGGVRIGILYNSQTPERQARVRKEVLAAIEVNMDAERQGVLSPAVLVTAMKA